jgi:hypothetical protein
MVLIDKFCLTYKNTVKRNTMMRKFDQLNWHVRMFEGVDVQDNTRAPTPDQIQQALAHNRWDPHA